MLMTPREAVERKMAEVSAIQQKGQAQLADVKEEAESRFRSEHMSDSVRLLLVKFSWIKLRIYEETLEKFTQIRAMDGALLSHPEVVTSQAEIEAMIEEEKAEIDSWINGKMP